MEEKQKYYYQWYIGECPECGKDKSYRKRVSTKPKGPIYLSDTQTYDHCMNIN